MNSEVPDLLRRRVVIDDHIAVYGISDTVQIRHIAMGNKVYPSGSGWSKGCVYVLRVSSKERTVWKKLGSPISIENVIQYVIGVLTREEVQRKFQKTRLS